MAGRKNKKKILLTGGHAATTALSVTEEIIRRSDANRDIYWVGTKKALEGKRVESLESRVLPEMGVNFHPIVAGRLQRKFTIWTIPSIAKIPIGFIQAFNAVRKIRPDVILSFGGFAAFPVVFWGFIFGIPVVLHEQTSAVGRANKFSAAFAKTIAVAREASVKYLPKEKVKVVGNPIMTQIAEIKAKESLSSPPLVFITGGSRGSKTINSLIEGILRDLLQDYYVVHQTGDMDFEKFEKIKEKLPGELGDRYELYSLIDPMQIDGVYKRADVVVARAGANTVSELVAAKIPSVLVPIPWSYQNEQRKNASYAKSFGIARVLDQDTAKSEDLYQAVKAQVNDWDKIKKEVGKVGSPDIKASQKLVDILEEEMK